MNEFANEEGETAVQSEMDALNIALFEGFKKILYCLCSGCIAASIATLEKVETAVPYFFLDLCLPAILFIWGSIKE